MAAAPRMLSLMLLAGTLLGTLIGAIQPTAALRHASYQGPSLDGPPGPLGRERLKEEPTPERDARADFEEKWARVLQEADESREESAASGSRAPLPPVCIMGRAVPQIYFLGVQKAGTTTMAGDLVRAGIEPALGGRPKELHLFDAPCGYHVYSSYKRHISVCDIRTFDVPAWTSRFRQCDGEVGGPYADMTPCNARLNKLPALLRGIYGGKTANLTFVILLREPLQRFHSGFYDMQPLFNGEEAASTFTRFTQESQERWRQALASGGLEKAASHMWTDQLYRSMYGASLAPWLEGAFEPRQFLVVPAARYFQSLDFRRQVVAALSELSGASLHAERLRTISHLYGRAHAPLEEDLSNDAIAAFRRDFFDPDTQRLAELLAPAVKGGLRIAGYTGPPDAAAIRQYLTSSW